MNVLQEEMRRILYIEVHAYRYEDMYRKAKRTWRNAYIERAADKKQVLWLYHITVVLVPSHPERRISRLRLASRLSSADLLHLLSCFWQIIALHIYIHIQHLMQKWSSSKTSKIYFMFAFSWANSGQRSVSKTINDNSANVSTQLEVFTLQAWTGP